MTIFWAGDFCGFFFFFFFGGGGSLLNWIIFMGYFFKLSALEDCMCSVMKSTLIHTFKHDLEGTL